MNLKRKSIAIGIIALFIGLAITPMSSADRIEMKEADVPVKVSVYQNDGTLATKTVKLMESDVKALEDFLQTLQNIKSKSEMEEKITEFFTCHSKSGLNQLFSLEWLEKLPGRPIFSFGKGSKLFSHYHGRIQIKKLFDAWTYPNGFGTTVIWGDGLSAPPTQILLKRQVGFMIGFVGLYVQIPPLVSGMSSRTLFIGSSLFAWGAAI